MPRPAASKVPEAGGAGIEPPLRPVLTARRPEASASSPANGAEDEVEVLCVRDCAAAGALSAQ